MPKINLPVTRYYGSKRKLVDRIWTEIERKELNFDSVLDVFGGTGSFSYFAKQRNKTVIFNDIFKFNSVIAKKLIEQTSNELSIEEAIAMLIPVPGRVYRSVISDNFGGIYFTDSENQEIDYFVQNIEYLDSDNKKASAYYILLQSCIIKRPYNLFHRNNLNMRVNYTGGGFGNKKTWERPFAELFERFIKELNTFCFDNGHENFVVNFSALNCPENADLVYIDPPYFTTGSNTTYHSKYHFLEGLVHYNEIEANINHDKRNKEISINRSSEFENKVNFINELQQLFGRHSHSHIVMSYRNNGKPTIDELAEILRITNINHEVSVVDMGVYGYALAKNNNLNNEFVIIGKLR